MSASAKCHHPEIGVFTQPVLSDNGKMVLLIQGMSCAVCSARFRFVGLGPTLAASETEPTMSRDGNAVSLPAVEIAA